MRTGHDPRLLRQKTLQLIDTTDRILRIRSTPPFHLQAQSLSDSQPSGAVSLMIQFRQNQLIPRLEVKRRREVMQELRCRRSYTYLYQFSNRSSSKAGVFTSSALALINLAAAL